MRRALAFLVLLASTGIEAAEISATLADGKLGARVDALSYPVTLPKELTSGLTNRLYVQVSVADANTTIAQKVVEIAIRYDLWDERFSVFSTMDGTITESRTLASLPEVSALLAALPLPRLFEVNALPAGADLTLRVEVLLNPIDREKMQMIRKWVAQNNTPEVGGRQGISVSNAIFNRILEQYANGSNVAAAWRASVASAPFRLDSLTHEKR
ncbi:MAG TPA: hypothetical protein VFU13_17195 [Steroidobacteraceae bacterium]|nr:hypothetical protein [Steroidobacteraceae bacterium]